MNAADLMTFEDLASITGCTYRTCKKRLEQAGIDPVHSSAKSDFYAAGHAIRAVLSGDPALNHQRIQGERYAARILFPVLFAPDGLMACMLTGHLTNGGMSKEDAGHVLGLAALGAMLTLNQFFGYGDPETGWDDTGAMEFTIPQGLREMSSNHRREKIAQLEALLADPEAMARAVDELQRAEGAGPTARKLER